MKKQVLIPGLLVLALAVLSGTTYAASLSCKGGIVSDGDSRVDLLSKCGEPDARESHDEVVSERLDDGTRRKTFITVDDWTYNFGPTQLQRVVTLKNGVVTDIRTASYGYEKGTQPTARDCSEQVVSQGDLKSDVLAKCGEPTWKDEHEEEFSERLADGTVVKRYIPVEVWTYNLGPNRFMRVLTFRNGKLTDISTGSYGY
jgi:hypothetical protein